jgi:hypothetical protein
MEIRYVPVDVLEPEEVERIWVFFSGYTERKRERFEAGLVKADEVFLCERDGRLVGFGTTKTVAVEHGGVIHDVIYTPYGTLAPEVRGGNVIRKTGLRAFIRAKRKHPMRPAYWMFAASTMLSYGVMAKNFATFYPRRDVPTPPREAALMAAVMREVDEHDWDEASGRLVRNGASRYLEGAVPVDPATVENPDLRFYCEKNPHQQRGDSLVCIAPLDVPDGISILVKGAKKLVS